MKTLYDWMPGARGQLLIPVNPVTLSRAAIVDVIKDPKLFRELIDNRQLTGTALADATDDRERRRESRS